VGHVAGGLLTCNYIKGVDQFRQIPIQKFDPVSLGRSLRVGEGDKQSATVCVRFLSKRISGLRSVD
jgi:hypothetical protein